jgi:hypothetical protein
MLVVLFMGFVVTAQTMQQTDNWKALRYFVGTWEGTGTGQPGESKVEREYKFVLNGKFLQANHRSTYAPQPKNPKGEVHDDFGYFSYDKPRRQFVFRQFHVEGFVTEYVATSISPDGKTIVLDSESIENIPTGWRARETLRILNETEFTETFELSGPGKEFQVYSENKFKRKLGSR